MAGDIQNVSIDLGEARYWSTLGRGAALIIPTHRRRSVAPSRQAPAMEPQLLSQRLLLVHGKTRARPAPAAPAAPSAKPATATAAAEKPAGGTLSRALPKSSIPVPGTQSSAAATATATTAVSMAAAPVASSNRLDLQAVRSMNGGFVYCNMVRDLVQPVSPYELEVVPYAKVEPDNYYTISATNVTHFYGGDVEITSLAQWEREANLYRRMMQIKFFRRYRIWKAFMVRARASHSLVGRRWTSSGLVAGVGRMGRESDCSLAARVDVAQEHSARQDCAG